MAIKFDQRRKKKELGNNKRHSFVNMIFHQ